MIGGLNAIWTDYTCGDNPTEAVIAEDAQPARGSPSAPRAGQTLTM